MRNSLFFSLFITFAIIVFISCSDYNKFNLKNTIGTSEKLNENQQKWEGTPFVEWTSSTFLNQLHPYLTTGAGILTMEGIISDDGFKTEKAVLLNYKNGQKIWRYAYRPISSMWYNIKNPLIIKTKSTKHPIILASWVDGDLFRIQDLITGKDLWNKPNCKYISSYKNKIFGYCMGKITIMSNLTGQKLRSAQIPFKPILLMARNSNEILIENSKFDVYLYNFKSSKLTLLKTSVKIKFLKLFEDKILWVHPSNDGNILEMFTLTNSSLAIKWSVDLNEEITDFWTYKTDNSIIYPTGMECISSININTGKENWTSCGIYEKTPPAWDNDGLYMLSSRLVKNSRPLIFIDQNNGMQTPLFQNNKGENSVVPISAFMLTPGQAYHGMIYAVKNKSKLLAIRIAAP